MTRLWIGAFVICGLAPLAVAQRGGGMGGLGAGRAPGAGGIGGGRGAAGAGRFAGRRGGGTGWGNTGWGNTGWGSTSWRNANGGQFGGAWGYPGSGYGGWGYAGGYSDMDGSEPTPMVLMLPAQPPEPPPPPPPPPAPANPVIHTYSWSDAGAPTAGTFLILSKDGTARPAVAVWVQESELHYMAADGVTGRVGINTIDREATARVNAERGLRFWLPDRR